jgi:hypothetical protein
MTYLSSWSRWLWIAIEGNAYSFNNLFNSEHLTMFETNIITWLNWRLSNKSANCLFFSFSVKLI